MFRVFFSVTLSSLIVLWYCHEYHTETFMEIIQKIPFANEIAGKIHIYMSCSSSMIEQTDSKMFTSDELKQYNGEKDSKGIYLAILGEVYDVEKGRKHYGPGGAYHVFAGKDASRSFVTGNFDLYDPIDHVIDLSYSELLSLRDWLKFYKREYEFKGKLVGRFYDKDGKKTEYYEQLQKKFDEAEMRKEEQRDEELVFPPCNVEWNVDTGTKVWCSNRSGGIDRNWIGVPRKLYMVGSEFYRCACVDLAQLEKKGSSQYARRGLIQLYDDCDASNSACYVKV